jgi:hypothetical protein
VVGTVTFAAVVAVAIPPWGAAGATTAVLAGTLATVVCSARAFPDVLTPRRLAVSVVAAALAVAGGMAQ